MDSSGFSSPRTECFPAGLRVLVVDDDPTWLKILEKMLKKCNYEVTTCNLAREALDLLRERKDGFDIVISDVNMPDMDGFKLLEHVGLEMDLPVIMMSVDGETSRVMKGVQHGACDYLLKPIRMKELRNIWQHVFRKKIHEVRDIEGHESLEEIQMLRCGAEQFEDGYFFNGDFVSGKKRKDNDNKHDDRVNGDSSSAKKARVVWTVDLHQKFVKAVNQIGFEKVGPKKILDLMGVPWLTRENVASHLQKYRLYLTRLQKENDLKATFCGTTKDSDFPPKDPPVNVCLQSPTAVQQNIQANESYAQKIPVHIDESKISHGNVKGILSMTMTEPKKTGFADTADLSKTSSSRISFGQHSFDLDVKFEPKIQVQYSWSSEVPVPPLQFKKQYKAPHFHPGYRFDHLQPSMHHHMQQVNSVEPSLSHNPETSSKESDKRTQPRLKPSFDRTRNQGIEKVTKVESRPTLFPIQPESHLTDSHAVDPMWNMKNHSLEQNPLNDLESSQRNLILGLWDEEFNDYSSQGAFYQPNGYLGNIESIGYNTQELIGEVPPHLYDALKFDSECPSEPVEYPVIDQGLFA